MIKSGCCCCCCYCLCLYFVCVCAMCVCVCVVCVWERERESEWVSEWVSECVFVFECVCEWVNDWLSVCVCVCVSVKWLVSKTGLTCYRSAGKIQIVPTCLLFVSLTIVTHDSEFTDFTVHQRLQTLLLFLKLYQHLCLLFLFLSFKNAQNISLPCSNGLLCKGKSISLHLLVNKT